MEKFYTPEFAELLSFIMSERYIFAVYRDNEKLAKLVFPDPIETSIKSFIETNDMSTNGVVDSYTINTNLYRIPFLTHEDIESLGFKYNHRLSNENEVRYEDHFERIENVVIYDLGVSSEGVVKIKGWYHDNPRHPTNKTIFAGTIKNKSELKVLLKQLGI